MKQLKITGNGDYAIDGVFSNVYQRVVVLMPDTINGTVVIGYNDATDTFVPLEGDITAGALEAGKQYHIQHGLGSTYLIKITNYTADFEIRLIGQDG